VDGDDRAGLSKPSPSVTNRRCRAGAAAHWCALAGGTIRYLQERDCQGAVR
jgi:putative hemolysin